MIGGSRRFLFLILVFSALAFGLACGGGDGSSGDSDSGSDGDSGSEDGGSSSGGSVDADLRLLGADPLTLDPALVFETTSARYVLEIFGGLVTIDRNLQIVPDIAETWTVSDDGTVYTFTLRRDALFHDGRTVTAQDFVYSLNRTALLGRTQSLVAEAFLGDIVGAKDVIRGRAETISGVQAIDSSTLQITIDEPKSFFIAKLTYSTAFVVDQQQVEANPRNWTRKPNGTGPFKLVEWRVNERIILEANERYHLGAPGVHRIFFNLAGGSALTQYENNELDVSGISTSDIERVLSNRDVLSADYRTGPNLSLSYIAFNTDFPPFDDPKVRLAFALAIDREQISRVVIKGMQDPATSFMMPGLPGFNNETALPTFDPEAARQALAESTYGSAENLPIITLTESGGGASVGFETQAIIEMWRTNLGVEVSIEQAEAATFYDDIDRGRLQMWTLGWIMDYPDPENLLDLLFHSASRKNDTSYSNPAFDALIEQARTEQDVEKRLRLYQEAELILIEDLPWIPMMVGRDHFVVKPYVIGYEPLPMLIPSLRYVSIEK